MQTPLNCYSAVHVQLVKFTNARTSCGFFKNEKSTYIVYYKSILFLFGEFAMIKLINQSFETDFLKNIYV